MTWMTIRGDRARWIARVGGVVLLLLGFLAVLMYGAKYTLTCEQGGDGQVTCRESRTWFGLFLLAKQQAFTPVEAATVELDCRTDASQDVPVYECFYNKVRLSGAGEFLQLSMSFNETSAADAADRINAYLVSSTGPSLVIESLNLFEVVLGNVFVALPCFALGILLLIGQRAKKK